MRGIGSKGELTGLGGVEELAEDVEAGVDLVVGAGGDPEAVAPVGIVHVADEDLVGFEVRVDRLVVGFGVLAPDEIGLGGGDVEAE